jgi:hypothetical protein
MGRDSAIVRVYTHTRNKTIRVFLLRLFGGSSGGRRTAAPDSRIAVAIAFAGWPPAGAALV